MQIIPLKNLNTWPAPTSTDVKDGTLLTASLKEFFHLTIAFPGLKKGDRIDTQILVTHDRFSPPQLWSGQVIAGQDNSETFQTSKAPFSGTFSKGTGVVSFTAQGQSSAPLEFSITS
ncbi:hypothetical protein [uncultured Pseudomonas sp.]|jgi:hypothetical protein|uniref:hypothetical protein n=1 Tax=uncultured Pseudomonas sp. TaxID=114707 RepID=UPI0025D58039|nr:hypothetical protein [uncultured Pseudomonas sp.]